MTARFTAQGYQRGEARWSARLREADVLEIRSRYADGESLHSLHLRFPQCSKPNLHHVVTGKTWTYLLPNDTLATPSPAATREGGE